MTESRINKSLMLFFGITLLTQAVTSLIGGSIFMSPFEVSEINEAALKTIAETAVTGYISIMLQMITAVVIVLLGVAMYRIADSKYKTMAIVALCLYTVEAVMLAVSQSFVFGLIEISKGYAASGDTALIATANIISVIEDFTAKMAMIPFGIGAVMFYWLITQAGAVPKWLGWYGIITVPFILIFTPIMAFNIDIPFFFLVPYVPFEFFTGVFVIAKAVRLIKYE